MVAYERQWTCVTRFIWIENSAFLLSLFSYTRLTSDTPIPQHTIREAFGCGPKMGLLRALEQRTNLHIRQDRRTSPADKKDPTVSDGGRLEK